MKRKFPRIKHLPWSEGQGSDDKTLDSVKHFEGQDVVVTLKMDGENSTIARDYYHARSLDSRDHASRSWIKQLQATLSYQLTDGEKLAGENMFAKHSIGYDNLESYFYLFGVWGYDWYFDWEHVEMCSGIFNLPLVSVLYKGVWDEDVIRNIKIDPLTQEGYVVRTCNGFNYEDFDTHIAKYVRKGHVQTDDHWMHSKIEQNKLIV